MTAVWLYIDIKAMSSHRIDINTMSFWRCVPTGYIGVGQEPTALAVGAGGGCLDIFSLVYHFSFLSPSLSGRGPDID